MAVSRETLYEQVWGKPMLELGEDYGVSSSYLARICRLLNVPCPPRGYWARLRGGQKPRRPALPPARPGDDIEWDQKGRAKTEPWPYPKAPSSFRRMPVSTPAAGTKHPLIAMSQEAFAIQGSEYEEYLKPSKRALLDLHVSKWQVSRALEVVNQVLLDLAARGYDAELESPREPIHWIDFKPIDPKTKADCYPWGWWSPHRATVIHIGTVAIGLSFYEIKEEVRAKRVRNEWVPVEEEPELPHRGRRNAYQQDLRNMPGGRLGPVFKS